MSHDDLNFQVARSNFMDALSSFGDADVDDLLADDHAYAIANPKKKGADTKSKKFLDKVKNLGGKLKEGAIKSGLVDAAKSKLDAAKQQGRVDASPQDTSDQSGEQDGGDDKKQEKKAWGGKEWAMVGSGVVALGIVGFLVVKKMKKK